MWPPGGERKDLPALGSSLPSFVKLFSALPAVYHSHIANRNIITFWSCNPVGVLIANVPWTRQSSICLDPETPDRRYAWTLKPSIADMQYREPLITDMPIYYSPWASDCQFPISMIVDRKFSLTSPAFAFRKLPLQFVMRSWTSDMLFSFISKETEPLNFNRPYLLIQKFIF